MTSLPENLFLNPVLTALQTAHMHLAVPYGKAIRYPATVAPFACIASPTTAALHDLRALLTSDEYVWVTALGAADPTAGHLTVQSTIDVLQMVFPSEVQLPQANPAILHLTCARAPEMVALTDIAFPGFFRPRTCEMGNYFGIYTNGETKRELIAMGGERLVFHGYSEISGLCTHPDHRGQGHAAQMLWHLMRLHRSKNILPWLHVTATNINAVDLYLKLGFQTVRNIKLHKLSPA